MRASMRASMIDNVVHLFNVVRLSVKLTMVIIFLVNFVDRVPMTRSYDRVPMTFL